MKLFLALVSLVATAATASSSSSMHLRGPDDEAAPSPCEAVTSSTTCQQTMDNDQQSCVWCSSQAVQSACFSNAESQALPASVFHCETPGTSTTSTTTKQEQEPKSPVYQSSLAWEALGLEKTSYQFLESNDDNDTTTYHLLHKQHDADTADLCDASSKSISGYMDIDGSRYDSQGENKHLFFWMFEKRGSAVQEDEQDEDIPFVVWLTGGPGCSSTLALLTENGPCKVNAAGDGTTVNPYSWTEAAHVLWLDQPAGVGFSYGDENDKNEGMIAEDAYFFLQAFFQTYPQYAKKTPFLYIVGESYGGHYAPAIAHRVWQGNQKLATNEQDKKLIKLPLAGLAIGNGLTSPEEQYPWYPEMVFNNSHHIQVVDETTYKTMKAIVPKCTKLIHQCNQGDSMIDNFACQTAFLVCNAGLTSPYQMTGLNPYDIRIKCAKPPLCYDFGNVQTWLNREDTMKALGVDTNHVHRWESCNFGINMKFHTDWMKDFSGYVQDLLDKAHVPVLIYAGDVDFICNYMGNQAWTLGLPWAQKDAFNAATPVDWNKQGLSRSANADGSTKTGMTFLQVYDAGHMVPSDQPKVALDMIATFLKGGAFH